ncbi:MAG: Formylmethanofuran--tetrahydromethanopterin formyltransferase [Firmicutes bacterium]|nr:Formylmethanofuran--tetrahydromethanopterin formyltransferase [Bacillota bacterium]
MRLNGVAIEDTFAEAFAMWGARVVITARSERWAMEAARKMTGMATSVIGCGVEADIEGPVACADTPDGRVGVSVLLFAPNREGIRKRLVDRVGQCVLTCPTTACFDGLAAGEDVALVGGTLRFFGDGYQGAKRVDGSRYNRIPVMDGEFLVAHSFHITRSVGGGNFLLLGETQESALAAAERAVMAIDGMAGVIMPFPGGIVRSGSKVGSHYKGLMASTNEAYCPTLRGRVNTALPANVGAVYEVVLDGLNVAVVEQAMAVGIRAACGPGVVAVTAGNYGGKLGPYHMHLHRILGGGGGDGEDDGDEGEAGAVAP